MKYASRRPEDGSIISVRDSPFEALLDGEPLPVEELPDDDQALLAREKELASAAEPPPSRAEFDDLKRRIEALESASVEKSGG